ncbi:MAG: rhomboid family intramembrane serine protease [Nanoarchaeota archaeon]
MQNIKSESKIAWKLFKDILMLPVNLLLLVFGKKSISDVLRPVSDIFRFIFEAKVTIWLVILNIIIYFGVTFLLITGIIEESFIDLYFIGTTRGFLNLDFPPLIGSWFFHASVFHLFGNMLFLFILGRVVEKELGGPKTLLIYFGAAIISTVADNLVHIFIIPIKDYAVVGASGAISGLGGAALLLSPFYLTYLVVGIPLPIIFVVLLQIYTDITGVLNPTSNIGHIAHLTGYLSVAITMFLLSKNDRNKMKKGLFICIITVIASILVFIFANRFIGLQI